MIHEVQIHTAWQHGDCLASAHRLRKQMFVDAGKWTVPTYDGMEYDQFDTLEARYLMGIDEGGVVRAVQRNLFCDRPYMMKTLWPELASTNELPDSCAWAEGTRMGVDQTMSGADQMRWFSEVVIAHLEWALFYGVEHYTFVTYEAVARHMLETNGMPVEYWGGAQIIDGAKYVAGYYKVDQALLDRTREKYRIFEPVFVPVGEQAPLERWAVAS